jgi:hypothetical protein
MIFARVFHQRHATIFVADDEVEIAVAIPVDRNGDDHLQIHRERGVAMFQPSTSA